ncbi:MAG: hypothetical protein PHV74_09330 [Dehalococcoidia bacterium]|nr:hypothetical protein [Dehalococcoidia bacterium]
MKEQYDLKWLNDPGHGWLEVPRSVVNELGISKQITSFSYQQGDQIYLEEDCDASLFLDTCEKRGIKITTWETHHDDDRVRNMDCYSPS